MPLPAWARNAASLHSRRSCATSAPQRPSLCWMLGRNSCPLASSNTTAGVIPVTPTASISAASMPPRCNSSWLMAQTLSHHCSGFSSAQPGCGDDSSTGRLARASTRSGSRSRMPMVEVGPISNPSTQLTDTPQRCALVLAPPTSAQAVDHVHEPLDARAVHRFPRVATPLEMRADDDARHQAQYFRYIVDVDAGIGKNRHIGDGLRDTAQIGPAGGLPGQWP